MCFELLVICLFQFSKYVLKPQVSEIYFNNHGTVKVVYMIKSTEMRLSLKKSYDYISGIIFM